MNWWRWCPWLRLMEAMRLGRSSSVSATIYWRRARKVYQTNNQLVKQLCKYLDDQAWLENKRIMELVRSIEK
ncbi:hypothetical protein Ga0076813_16325 [endosymbiont of Ridgeia piscesae]|uniref:Uncharacterized protein n=1 Tax=endosymbiont of Ridgeia piscesae TaxID=54398 RepID=A0A0T5ZAK2_9GAMM|nr:hypothetical protein Ga0076813_16325 [endosymbiont of Ridgeia piscesae]